MLWLHREGYIPLTVEVKNTQTGENEKINLCSEELSELFGSEEVVTEESVDMLNMTLLIKDSYNISGGAYHELAAICKSLPRHYKIKQRIRKLNELWNIRPIPHGIGVQQSLEQRLHIRLEHLLKVSPHDAEFVKKQLVRVKLSGDGTNIGKRLHVVTFTFTLLEEGNKAHSSDGNHILAVFKEPEKYESVKAALEDISGEVERLTSVRVSDMDFHIKYHLGGDWKFLAMVTGIDAASSEYTCIFNKCKTSERFDTEKEWSISDPTAGARTIEENLSLFQLPKSRKKYNVSNCPIFPSIPLTHVVIDNLHLFLRVSDKLITLLVSELRRQDKIDRQKKFTSFDPVKYKHCDGYQKFVTSLGISNFEFYIGRTSRELKTRSLTGPGKLKVFHNKN